MNFRIDAEKVTISKTGAAVNGTTILPSLKMARAALELEALAKIAKIRDELKKALHTKEADLPTDNDPQGQLSTTTATNAGTEERSGRRKQSDAA